MKELSVFIDESGDFGEVKEHQGLSQMQKKLNRQEAAQSSLTNMFISICSMIPLQTISLSENREPSGRIVTRKIKAENQSFQLKIINAGDGT